MGKVCSGIFNASFGLKGVPIGISVTTKMIGISFSVAVITFIRKCVVMSPILLWAERVVRIKIGLATISVARPPLAIKTSVPVPAELGVSEISVSNNVVVIVLPAYGEPITYLGVVVRGTVVIVRVIAISPPVISDIAEPPP